MKVKVGNTGKVIGVAIIAIVAYFVIAPKLKKSQVVDTTKDSIVMAVDSGLVMQKTLDSLNAITPIKKTASETKTHLKKAVVIKKETINKKENKVDGSRENLELQ